ncbi:threonyl-tRNA synthetase [Peziza echinospora]|nr:threonyl-tRNA synthetase [Peziza echinospora]
MRAQALRTLPRQLLPFSNRSLHPIALRSPFTCRPCSSCPPPDKSTPEITSWTPATSPRSLDSKAGSSSKARPARPAPKATPPDHRTLATEHSLFFTDPVSPGSPIFLPNGTKVFHKLQEFLRAQYAHYGFEEVLSPTIYKKSLWEQSGHWEKYRDDMFEVKGRDNTGGAKIPEGAEISKQEEEFGLKPMNCPGHCLIFKSSGRSYRDLPIRYADFSPLHRNEASGTLSGLTRVRRFHQDDAHIFCRPSQIASEISATLDFINVVYTTFKLPTHRLVLSTRPENYIGDVETWDRAEEALKGALNASKREWTLSEGDGAFYGPKIDIMVKDSDGKEHQTATIQLDFQLPERFELSYMAPAPEAERRGVQPTNPEELNESGYVRPVIIHRAILGSLERFMALLIEQHNGTWPFWLSPRQAIVLPVAMTDEIVAFSKEVQKKISGLEAPNSIAGGDLQSATAPVQSLGRRRFNVEMDMSNRSLSKMVREAKAHKFNHLIVVGEKNVASRTVTVTPRGDGSEAHVKSSEMTADEVYDMFVELEKKYQ